MAETVNTGAILTSDGNGGYSKLFTESMTDIVKLQNGSSLTEKLAEIDGKLPIVLTSGQLPETLDSGRLYVTENEIMCGLNGGSSAKLYPQSGSSYVHPTTKQCNYSYTHPSTKQCSWSPNLSNYATKSELNELRDMIESSQGPTIVGSGTVPDAANAGRPVHTSISSCNYVVVTLLNPPTGYTDTATVYKGSSVILYSNRVSYLYEQTFSLNSSGTQLTASAVEYEDPDRRVNIRGFSWIAYK